MNERLKKALDEAETVPYTGQPVEELDASNHYLNAEYLASYYRDLAEYFGGCPDLPQYMWEMYLIYDSHWVTNTMTKVDMTEFWKKFKGDL